MTKKEFFDLSKAASEYSFDDFEDIFVAEDRIIYTNNPSKLFDNLKRDLVNGKPKVEKLIKIEVNSETSVAIHSYTLNSDNQLIEDDFKRNLVPGQKPDKQAEPRIVIIVNFERLSTKTKLSLRYANAKPYVYPTGNAKVFNNVGSIRTTNDSLFCLVDSSNGGDAGLDPGAANHFSHEFIYCE